MLPPDAPAPDGSPDGTRRSYGGFVLGPLSLALPMAALREVLPMANLSRLPCPAPCVLGGMDLRGVLLPVLDLRLLLGHDSPPPAHPVVIVMVWEGHILGLLADGVTGVFSASRHHDARSGEAAAQVLAGVLQRDDTGALVSVLSPRALASVPGVPLIDDPEPERQQTGDTTGTTDADSPNVPMMLMRCGALTFALDAMAVHTTLDNPVLLPSVAAVGHCRGVIRHGGLQVPAVDLLALCGMGQHDGSTQQQAFVMRLDAGLVALLVNRVIDVVRTTPQDVVPVPRFALPEPALFAGALPATVLPEDHSLATGARHAPPTDHFLLLDGAALRASPALQAFARIGGQPGTTTAATATAATATQAGQAAQAAAAAPGQRGPRQSLVTFDLFGETATPIEQVAEILPYNPQPGLHAAGQGGLLGMVVNRGRSIPLVCLRRLAGMEPLPLTPQSSVLVVKSDGDWLGFTVPRLRAIESTQWTPALGAPAAGTQDALQLALNARTMALVGEGVQERMLRVLDLAGIARALRGVPATPPQARPEPEAEAA